MIPFNTQLFLSSSTIQIALRLTVSSPCCNSVFRYDLTGAGWCDTGCTWVRGFKLTTWLRVTDSVMAKDVSSEDDACMLESDSSLRAGRLWCACARLIQHHPGFVSSLCSSLCRWQVSLRQSFHSTCMAVNNNRCTGLEEIRLRDTQLKINKKITHHTCESAAVAPLQPKQEILKIRPELPAYQKREVSSLIAQSVGGCLQTYLCNSTIMRG